MMKKIIFAVVLCMLTVRVSIQAQFTKGGTYKNYEKYHVSYDTIKTQRTELVSGGTMEKAGYFFINAGPSIPIGMFAKAPSATYVGADYNGMGGMGGSTGFDIGLGGIEGIRAVNQHLIPQIDLGVYNAVNFTYLPWTYGDYSPDPSNQTYDAFMALNFSVGPAIIFNPMKDVDFHIDLMYKLGLGLTFGGEMRNSSIYFDVTRDEIGLTFFHGPNINLRYSFLLVGFELNMMGEYGYFTYEDWTGAYSISANLPLNNFAIKLGAAF